MNRGIRLTATAREHVRREQEWWRANRDHVDVFTDDLEQALKIIAVLPGAGTLYTQSPVPGVRRVYLRRIDAHIGPEPPVPLHRKLKRSLAD